MTKIKAIIATDVYYIGKMINNLKIGYFKDESIRYTDNIYSIYRGYTPDNKLIVEFINTPIIVEYY